MRIALAGYRRSDYTECAQYLDSDNRARMAERYQSLVVVSVKVGDSEY